MPLPLPSLDDAKALLDRGAITAPQYASIVQQSQAKNPYSADDQYASMASSQAAMPSGITGPIGPPTPEPAPAPAPERTPEQKEYDAKATANASRASASLGAEVPAKQLYNPAPLPSDKEREAAQAKLQSTVSATPALPKVTEHLASPATPVTTGTGSSTSPQMDYLKKSDENVARDLQGIQSRQDAQVAIGDAKAAGAQKAADIEQTAIAQDTLDKAALVQHQETANTSMAKRTKDLEDRINGMKDIDPEHWWHEKSTGGKVLAALSIGLGALGSGLSGIHGSATPNYALNIINDAIGRDVDSQKTNLQKEWNKITHGQEISKDTYARDQWMLEQESKERSAKWGIVQHQLQVITSQTDSTVAKANAKDLSGQLEGFKSQEVQKSLDRRLSVLQTIQARQASAAAAAAHKREKYDDKVIELAARYDADPNFQQAPGSKLSRSDEAKRKAYSNVYGVDLAPGAPEPTVAHPTSGSDPQKDLKAAAMESSAILQTIDTAKKNVGKITSGTTFGNAWSHNPAWVPGAASAREHVSDREAFNNTAKIAIGAAYKLGTDSTEPKRVETLNMYAKPYEILPTDNEETALYKMDNLKQLVQDSAAGKGVARNTDQEKAYLGTERK